MNIDTVIEWVQKQTLSQCARIVVWNRSSRKFHWIDSLLLEAFADNFPELLGHVHEKYICFASSDLLHQEESYLEENLLALETGQYALIVNLRGLADFPKFHLSQGRLPGNYQKPLFRMIVRKECVRDELHLDLASWKSNLDSISQPGQTLLQREPHLTAGLIIYHMRNQEDQESGIPFETQASEPIHLLDRFLFLEQPEQRRFEPLIQPLVPIQAVVPAQYSPSMLPTVFLIQPFLAVGGAEKIALKIMENLTDRVRFVVLTFEQLLPELGTSTELFRSITPYVYEVADFLPANLNQDVIEYLIHQFDPNAIYIANGTPWIYEALSDLKHQHPSIRLINQVYDDSEGWINRYDPSLLMYLDAHIGSNPKICQAYLQKGVQPEKIFLIENGTDPRELDPACYDRARIENLKLKLGLPFDKKVVTFAARLNPQKRPMDFVELARRFSTESEVQFLMVGDGPMSITIDEQVNKIELKNLHRQSFYRPINDILALTDVLVLPSEFEGMPMIVLEAQTMGKPVVATGVGNIPDILARTGGGVVVPQIGDITGLKIGLQSMLDNPPDPGMVRSNTITHFDWQVCAEKYLVPLLG